MEVVVVAVCRVVVAAVAFAFAVRMTECGVDHLGLPVAHVLAPHFALLQVHLVLGDVLLQRGDVFGQYFDELLNIKNTILELNKTIKSFLNRRFILRRLQNRVFFSEEEWLSN